MDPRWDCEFESLALNTAAPAPTRAHGAIGVDMGLSARSQRGEGQAPKEVGDWGLDDYLRHSDGDGDEGGDRDRGSSRGKRRKALVM